MAIRDILVHLDTNADCGPCLQAAIALALRKKAHLIGIAFALESSMLAYYGDKILPGMGKEHQDAIRTAATTATAQFAATVGQAELTFESRIVECSTIDVAEKMAFHARHVDMTFLQQPNPDEANKALLSSLLEGVLFNTGRPVYIVPYVGRRETPVHKAVIAWDGSYKAARTVNDALPLLRERGETVILVIDAEKRPKAHGERPGLDIAQHLERHGVNAKIVKMKSGDYGVDTTILNFVAETGADLLVMGAYGHSRLRERAFGGVTNTILEQMTVPVLMSN